jgi:Xaa-Pro dipeptidase
MSTGCVAFFKGANEVPLYSSDVTYPEYQEAFFYYLFGAVEMDCFGLIDFENKKSVLFVPKYDEFYKVWMTVLSLDQFKEKYSSVDEVMYTDDIEQYFKARKPSKVFLNLGKNSDSGLTTCVPSEDLFKNACPEATIDTTYMHDVACEARVLKHDEEIDVMRWASRITGEAHCNVMRNVKPGQRES